MARKNETDVRPLRANDITRWDDTADVIIVGSGCAGTSASLGALEAGADVLVLEAGGGLGGTSIVSSGQIYLGGGTPIQRACGFEDSAEEMFKYLMASCGPEPDADLIGPFCEESASHFDWLVAQGVPFKESFFAGAHEPIGDDCLIYSGSEHLPPYCDVARPAPRGHSPQVAGPKGPLLMAKLLAAADAAGQRATLNARCERLIVESDGSIAGVSASIEGTTRAFRAKGGVVLASGGFIFNDTMLERYAPRLTRCLKLGAGRDDGSGIQMGMAAGGDAIRMESGDVSLTIFPPTPIWSGLVFDGRGTRCLNETSYIGTFGEECVLRQDGKLFLLLDEATLEDPSAFGGQFAAVGADIAEVERELSLPSGSLQRSVALYNDYAAAGVDPMFHKAASYLKPLTNPPYAVIDLSVEAVHYAALTLGGLHIDPRGHVLDHTSQPIPGLFAAGRTTSGVGKQGYSSGISIADGTFFGRRAGQTAAARQGR